MDLCTLFVWFVAYSILGWLYESTFCTLQNRHWCNRGFLISPCCPIYGAGAVLDVLVCSRFAAHPALVFLICMGGSAVLEYTTAFVLERVFHVVCWDYNDFPLNLHGRICLPAAAGFGVGGLVVLYFIHPVIALGTALVPDAVMQAVALVLMALLAADTALTSARHTMLEQHLTNGQEQLDTRMEQGYQTAAGWLQRLWIQE